jgi:hypothetical protein
MNINDREMNETSLTCRGENFFCRAEAICPRNAYREPDKTEQKIEHHDSN